MSNEKHKTAHDKYCPICLNQLTEVISTGFLFCPSHSIVCDYEFEEGYKTPPLSRRQCNSKYRDSMINKKVALEAQLSRVNLQLDACVG